MALIITFALLAYTWAGYPLLLWLLRALFARPVARAQLAVLPRVSIILAVRNEEGQIAAKLTDCADLDCPADCLEILVVSDDSSDRTVEIAGGFVNHDHRITVLASQGRLGKSGAQNLAVERAAGDVLFFTDADTRMRPDTLKLILENFADPRVGLVTANVHLGQPRGVVAEGQGIYWRFELFLRQMESGLGILATGSGQLLMMRRELYRALPAMYGDDCVLPVEVRLQGFRVVQDTRVIVYDTMPHSIGGELRARNRITARSWAGTLARPAILNPFRFPLTSWALISHKLLRWMTPFFLALFLVANLRLAVRGQWVALCVFQIAFYLAASVGWLRARKGEPAWVFGYPFAFCLANVGFFLGIVKVIRGQKIVGY
ncbi:MAG TPA: glycosyltransferase [Candidatus Saccharimonadales bacterium]|nr:glycosyltransferase [Candidatus Saccharimonadales bacterium]